MAKEKEDNRDVFDKILDYVAPAAGAVVGGVAGRKIASKRKFRGDWAYKGHSAEPTRDLSDGLRRQAWQLDHGGSRIKQGDKDVTKEWSAKYKDQARRVDRMRAENAALPWAGAAAGSGFGYGAKEGASPYEVEIRKRRK